ncbi:SH3 domain-binding protein 2-like isoform X2 [Lineus longissimus]|uniref:SH3 domain-binding protein 2-like isoform X2 n=1 Tax=Lineus longissimus TaxID=88925 RepID=UPI00315C91EE
MDTELDLNIPTPQKNVASQQLLADGETSYHAYITKLKHDAKGVAARFQSVKNLLTPVRPVLVILNRGCLYCFKDDTSKKPSGSYTLFGYNRVIRAKELQTDKRPWVFQMEHASPAMETLAFSTPTQKDMEKWMIAIKQEMFKANRGTIAAKKFSDTVSGRPPGDGKDESLSDFVEQPIYDDISLTDVVYEVDKATKKNPVALMGKNSDDDDDDPTNYLEFESAAKPISSGKQRAPSNIASELDKTFARKVSMPGSGSTVFGKSRVPNVPPPSKRDFDKGPLPPTPGSKRSEPDGRSFKKPSTDNSKSQSPEKPSVAEKPRIARKQKTSPERAPELPPWNKGNAPKLPPARKESEADYKPKLPTGKKKGLDEPAPPIPVSPASKKLSITQADIDKDPSLYWKCHFFEGTKEEANAILAKLATDGVYLVRDSSGVDESQVLAVYCKKRTHKYLIRQEEGKYFLTNKNESEAQADSLENMLYHYHTNNLPNNETMLSEPYHLALLKADNT